MLLLLLGAGVTTPLPDLPFQGDAYWYDRAGGTGSIAGGTVLAGPSQDTPIGTTRGAAVLDGPDQPSPTGPLAGGTVLPPETIL